MRRNLCVFQILPLVVSCLFVEPVLAKNMAAYAEAKSRSGQVVYLEEDTMTFANSETTGVSAKYYSPDGKVLIAELSSSFSGLRYLPNTHFIDHRNGYEYKVTVSPDRKHVTIADRTGESQKWNPRELDVEDDLMTLQGSFVFVADHMDDLKAHKNLHVHFLVPSRKSDYRLRIAVDDDKKQEPNRLNLLMELENPFFRIFAPRIDVVVNPTSNQIESFSGVSNILDSDRHTQKVVVLYQYQNDIAGSNSRLPASIVTKFPK